MLSTEDRIANLLLAIANADSLITWALDTDDQALFTAQVERRRQCRAVLSRLQESPP
jgi:hypothetical protein